MKAECVGSLVWLAIGLGFVYGAIRMGPGTLQEPGSGFLSLLAGGFLTLFALILFFKSFSHDQEMQTKISALWEGMNWHRSVTIAVVVLGYILGLESIGFIICSFLLIFFMLKVLGNYAWGKAVLISAITTASFYLIFSTLLKVTLPKGILF
jgi:putative tricarboxylic transport membrane protein